VGSANAAVAGQTTELELMAELFGPDLDAAVVSEDVDSDGARAAKPKSSAVLKGSWMISGSLLSSRPN
jgi:hypothetical protein